MLCDEDRRRFAEDGYLLLPGIVEEALLDSADVELDAAFAARPAAAAAPGPAFLFLPPAELPAADGTLRRSGALDVAAGLVAPYTIDHALDHIQLALNIPPYPHRPGAPHIDGHRPGEPVSSFTMLAAIFLGDESAPDRGNLWVWPGSHLGHQQLFRERGPEALVPAGGHAALLDPPVWFGRGCPLLARRGDLLLAHFLLGHNIGGNTSPTTRRVLYYRLAAEGHAARWADTFTDAFTEYPSLRPFAPVPSA